MRSQTTRRLETIAGEIARARATLAMLRERLAEERRGLDESRLRMLMAETPVADRELQAAAGSYQRVRDVVERAEAELAALRREQRMLGERLGGSGGR